MMYEKVLELFDGRAVTVLCYQLGEKSMAMGQLKAEATHWLIVFGKDDDMVLSLDNITCLHINGENLTIQVR